MEKTKELVASTENRKAELVVQAAEGRQRLMEADDRIEAIEGIERGLESMKQQRGKLAMAFFQEFFAENGTPEHA